MYQEKKEEEDLQAFKIGLMYRYNESKTTYTSTEENWLHPSKTIQEIQSSTEQKYIINKTGKENISMDTLSDKETKSHTWKIDHG